MTPQPATNLDHARPLEVQDLGRLAYAPAHALQYEINNAVIAGTHRPTLLLLEHDPVITVSRRPAARQHLVASKRRLAELGIDVQETDRGGDITYHGPGQIVAYPILPLSAFGLNLGRYMRLLEQIIVDMIAPLGVRGERVQGATGVWARPSDAGPPAKLCAMGVRVRKNVTLHGLALNVHTNLDHFNTIVPCGLADQPVTSLHALLGEAAPTMPDAKRRLAETFNAALGRLA
ncbi:MAG: lipoyl(octanoyl) transferase LipB [Phycisphaeraceae bacterium]